MKNKKTILITIIIILIAITFTILITKHYQPTTRGLKLTTYEEIINKQENKDDFILIVSRSDCSHCLTYKPKVEQIAKNNGITVYYIDFDYLSNEDEFLNEFNLSGATPITLFFKNGKESSVLNRIEGDLASSVIKEKFKKMGFID